MSNSHSGTSFIRGLISSFLLTAVFSLTIVSDALAQPANDNPCGAFFITPTPTCSYAAFTTAAATSTPVFTPNLCANYMGGDVWFKTIVPCNGSIVFDTQIGAVNDGGMAVYSGTCNNLVFIECDDDDSPNGLMPSINLANRNPGDTIYIRFWEYGNDNPGTFGICVTEGSTAGSGNACSTASPFCTGTTYNFPNNTNIPSLGGGGIYGCLATTPNPVWYYMQIQNPGNISVTINQTNTAGTGIDVDFALWGPFPNLAIACTGISASNIVDCSYSTAATEIVDIPNALAGQFYMLLITNFANQPGNITFSQTSGVASTNCGVICTVAASNTGPVCGGGTVTLNATLVNNASYSWTGPNCFSSTLQNPDSVVVPLTPGNYTYTVYATTSTGSFCTSSTVVNVTNAVSATAATSSPACSLSSDGSITITPNTSGNYNYTFNPGNIQNTTGVLTGLTPGSYSVTFTNGLGCSGALNNIVLNPGAALTGTAATTASTCLGAADGSVTITPSVAGSYNYTINPGNIQNTTGIFSGLAAGNYNATFNNAAGCLGTVNNIAIANGAPLTGTSTTTPTTCPTSVNGTITITPSGGAGPYTFTLNPGNISQTDISSTTFTGLAPGNYTVNISSNNGCTGSVAPGPQITSGPALTDSTTKTDPPCYRINDGTISITPVGGQGPFTFTLTPGNIVQNGATSTTFSGLAAIGYTYNYTDAAGCQGSGSSLLSTNLPITTTSAYNMPLCNGDANGSISMTASGGVSPFEYSIDAGANYQSSNVINGLGAGTFTVRIRDNANCIKDTLLTLNEPALLTAFTDTIPSTCVGNDGTITITASGGTPAYTYSVDNGANYQNPNSFTVPDGNFSNILVRDANGCIAQTSAIVTRIDNMFLNILPEDTTICVESSIILRPETNPATSVFNWSSPDAGPGTINNPNLKNPTVTPTDTAHYILQAFLGVCERKDTMKINVLRKPVADAGLDSAICFDQRVIFLSGNASNVSGPVSYSWSPSAGLYTPDNQTSFGEIDASTTFTLSVTDNYGCNFLVTDQVSVNKQPPVPAFAGKDTIAIRGQTHQLQASGGSGYLWTPAALLDDPTSDRPVAILQNDALFIVLVTDIAGCVGSDTVFVKVYDGPAYYVPNAFSPNGDGLNDVFRPVPVGMTTTEFFRVFNRFGDIVFETNKWLQGWDGTYLGRTQATGTYVWVVKGKDRNGKTVEAKGTVVLIR